MVKPHINVLLIKYLKEDVEEITLLLFCKSLSAILENLGINEFASDPNIYHLSALRMNKNLFLFDVSYSERAP